MKRLLLIFTLLAAVMPCAGTPLSPEASLRRASAAQPTRRLTPAAMNLIHTSAESDTPSYYVFGGRDGGYLITSADDMCVPVLGYSDSGTFRYDSLPPAMRWWLSEYDRELTWVRSHPQPDMTRLYATPRPTREPIVSMVHARWNQNAPYNDLCVLADGQKAVTGCVATAMAQVMRYWKYPLQGVGSHSYTYNGSDHSFDFEATTFDWQHMPFILTSDWSAEDKLSVATLMRACGVSVDMQYKTSASGAQMSNVLPAFINYFKYAPSSMYLKRDYYDLYDWEDLVYSSLSHGCPVVYDGYGSGGHCFVVDGYQGDGYFHLNWGWGGSSDGYFQLSGLLPASSGIGGGNGGYNKDQGATIDLRPDFEGSAEVPQMTSYTYTLSLANRQLTYSGSSYNSGLQPFARLYLGMRFKADNGYERFVQWPSYLANVPRYYGRSTYYINVPANMPQGNYSIEPAFCMESSTANPQTKIYSMQHPIAMHNHYRLLVDADGNVELKENATDTVEVSDFQITTPVYANYNYGMSAILTNPSPKELYKDLYMGWFSESGNFLGVAPGTRFDVPAGESRFIQQAIAVPSSVNETPYSKYILSTGGKYRVALMEQTNTSTTAPVYRRLTDSIPVTIEPSQSEIAITCPSLIIANSSNVYASDLHLTMSLKGKTGFYGNNVIVFFLNKAGNVVTYQYSPVVFLTPGESKTLDLNIPFDAGEANTSYSALLNYITPSGNKYLNSANFTVGTTGVVMQTDDPEQDFSRHYEGDRLIITAPGPVTAAMLYNLQGLSCGSPVIEGNRVSLIQTSLPKGIYVLHIRTLRQSASIRIVI